MGLGFRPHRFRDLGGGGGAGRGCAFEGFFGLRRNSRKLMARLVEMTMQECLSTQNQPTRTKG